MAYVMVPVPEDQVQEVMQFVLRLMARAAVTPWDEQSLEALYADVDEPSRALLAAVADATIAGSPIDEQEAANTIQLNRRELAGIVRDVNEQAQEAGHPILLQRRSVSKVLPNGRTTEVRVLLMPDDIAPLVRRLDRAHLLADLDPAGDSGS